MTELNYFNNKIQLKTTINQNISIIIAAYNEEEGIVPTIHEFKEELKEAQIIVIDGNSSDKTIEISHRLGAKVLIQDGKGKGNAIAKGLANVKKDTCYVILTDADYTYPAKQIKKMINILNSNSDIGMVLGNRFSKIYEKISDRNKFYIGNKILTFIHNFFNKLSLSDPFTGLRVIRYNLLKGWTPKSQGFDIETEINQHIGESNYKIVEVPIVYRKRIGKKKLSSKHGLTILRRIIIG